MGPTRVLFVCLGNICRSPLAESIFQHLARERGVEAEFEVDSAGTSGYHAGDPPDARSVETARAKGVQVVGASRQLSAEDLDAFDYVIAMDAENLAALRRVAGPRARARTHRLREWDPARGDLDVPDPYYGGPQGFERVHEMIERSCSALLDHLLAEREG